MVDVQVQKLRMPITEYINTRYAIDENAEANWLREKEKRRLLEKVETVLMELEQDLKQTYRISRSPKK